jgi:p-aminobenzoyl-glutamate transporter AbgT
MKSSQNSYFRMTTVFFVLTLVVALCSWIGNSYEVGNVQSLLNPEGLRWILRNSLKQYINTPALGIIMILFIGSGIAIYGGLIRSIWNLLTRRKALTLKERRALILSLLTFIIYTLIIFSITIAPWTLLRNVMGTLKHSPFSQGIYYIISIGIGLVGMVYGMASGQIRNDKDVVRGMSYLFARCSNYFVVLFFVVQFFICLEYTNLASTVGIGQQSIAIIFNLCCYLPLVWIMLK